MRLPIQSTPVWRCSTTLPFSGSGINPMTTIPIPMTAPMWWLPPWCKYANGIIDCGWQMKGSLANEFF